jgi:hypothetical protein
MEAPLIRSWQSFFYSEQSQCHGVMNENVGREACRVDQSVAFHYRGGLSVVQVTPAHRFVSRALVRSAPSC